MALEDRFQQEKETLSSNCKRIRKERGILQSQIKSIVDLGQTRVSDIENAKQNTEFETLYKLKKGLQVDIKFLFGDQAFPISKMKFTDTTLIDEKKKFSQRLLQLLKHRSVSQRELSILIIKSDAEVSNFINNNHNIELLSVTKIAEALKVDLSVLFDYNGSLPSNVGYRQEVVK